MKIIVFLIAIALALASTAKADCVFCDTAQPSGNSVCNFGPIGYNLCTMNLSTCWVSGGQCGQGEIDGFQPKKRPKVMTLAYRAEHPDLQLSEQEVQDVIAECNQTPGCRWFYAGRDGGYGRTWGTLEMLYR